MARTDDPPGVIALQTYGQFYVYPLVDKLPIWGDRDQTQAVAVAPRTQKLHVVRSEGALYCVRLLGLGYGYVRAEDVISEYEAAKQAAAARQKLPRQNSYRPPYPTGAFPGDQHSGFVNVGFMERLIAYIIDAVILIAINYAIAVLLDVQRPGFYTETVIINGEEWERRSFSLLAGGNAVSAAWVACFVAGIAYYISSWTVFGATPGKMVLGQQIVHAQTGERIGLSAAILRYVGMIVAGIPLCLGYLWIIWDAEKQGWHDKIANTRVVR